MCQNAAKNAASLMAAIEPTIKNLLTVTGLIDTPNGVAAIKAYDAALLAVQSWQSGTLSQEVLELIADFQTVYNGLPIPAEYQVLGNIILGGIEAVIGVITANSPAPVVPAPAPVAGAAPAEELEEPQALHQAVVAHNTVVRIHSLVPGIKLTRFKAANVQYDNAWNGAVEKGGFPTTLKV